MFPNQTQTECSFIGYCKLGVEKFDEDSCPFLNSSFPRCIVKEEIHASNEAANYPVYYKNNHKFQSHSFQPQTYPNDQFEIENDPSTTRSQTQNPNNSIYIDLHTSGVPKNHEILSIDQSFISENNDDLIPETQPTPFTNTQEYLYFPGSHLGNNEAKQKPFFGQSSHSEYMSTSTYSTERIDNEPVQSLSNNNMWPKNTLNPRLPKKNDLYQSQRGKNKIKHMSTALAKFTRENPESLEEFLEAQDIRPAMIGNYKTAIKDWIQKHKKMDSFAKFSGASFEGFVQPEDEAEIRRLVIGWGRQYIMSGHFFDHIEESKMNLETKEFFLENQKAFTREFWLCFNKMEGTF